MVKRACTCEAFLPTPAPSEEPAPDAPTLKDTVQVPCGSLPRGRQQKQSPGNGPEEAEGNNHADECGGGIGCGGHRNSALSLQLFCKFKTIAKFKVNVF